jgi:hypothetical protein
MEHSKTKTSGIPKFFLGFSLGILLCVLVIFVVKNSNLFSKMDQLDLFNDDSDQLVTEQVQQPKKKIKKKIDESLMAQDSTVVDSTLTINQDNTESYEDAEFSMDPSVTDDNIAEEKLLQTKTIKVHIKNSNMEDVATAPDNIIAYFEVQKWESPIVNRISYQRNHNILKIKGMDISKLMVFYINGKYYLSDGSRLFSIPNNSTFEKMAEINIANL